MGTGVAAAWNAAWNAVKRGGIRHAILLLMVLHGLKPGTATAAVLAEWNFNSTSDTNHPATSAGAGVATVLGGLGASFSAGTGSSDPAGTNDLALSLSKFPAQGKGARSAGVQFEVSTQGYEKIRLRFDLRSTATASRKGVLLVATDGATFLEAIPFFIEADSVFTNGIALPLEFYTGVADNPRFAFRIVSDFSSGTNYTAVKAGSSYSTAGTWRLDMVTVTGEPKAAPQIPPQITESPHDVSVEAGLSAGFSVVATGTGPLSYQWLRGEAELTGETNAALRWKAVALTDAGEYRVRVRNGGGQVLSEIARLEVRVPTPPVLQIRSWIEGQRQPGLAGTNAFTEQVVRVGETLHCQVMVRDAAGRAIRWQPSANASGLGTGWSVDSPEAGTSIATWVWSPTDAEGSGVRHVTLEAFIDLPGTTPPIGSKVEWIVSVPTPLESQLALSEWMSLGVEAGGPGFNPLHRVEPAANPIVEDAFLEWINLGNRTLDLRDWTLWIGDRRIHRFNASALLAPTNAMVVYGGPLTGSVPRLPVLSAPASEIASGSSQTLLAPGEILSVRNERSNLVARIQLMPAEAFPGVSQVWNPETPVEFQAHPELNGARSSAGLRSDGRNWVEVIPEPVPDPIEARARVLPGRLVEIQWNATPGIRYIVERSTSPAGPFAPVFSGTDATVFTESQGPDWLNFFYRVRTP